MSRRGNRGNRGGAVGGAVSNTFKYAIRLVLVAALVLVGIYAFSAHGDEGGNKVNSLWDKAVTKINQAIDKDYQPDLDKINEKGSGIENDVRSGKYKAQVNEAFSNINPDDYKSKFPEAIETLKGHISREVIKDGYSRKQFMNNGNWNKVSDKNSIGWKDFKPDNCTVRQAVVMDVGKNVEKSKNPCKPKSGKWIDPYGSGKSTTNPSKFDLDHIVALSNAWKSGASSADWDVRNQIANDKDNLILSDSSTNRSKGDQRIDEWTPKKGSSAYCDYGARYAIVKAKYGLTVTQAEYDKLNEINTSCNK